MIVPSFPIRAAYRAILPVLWRDPELINRGVTFTGKERVNMNKLPAAAQEEHQLLVIWLRQCGLTFREIAERARSR